MRVAKGEWSYVTHRSYLTAKRTYKLRSITYIGKWFRNGDIFETIGL